MAKDEQRTFRREHVNAHASHDRKLMTPDAGGVDNELSTLLKHFACEVVAQPNALHFTIFHHEIHHFMIGQSIGTMATGIKHIGHSEAERVDGSIGNTHGTRE